MRKPQQTGATILILSTHAVVGAAVATLMPDHPGLAFLSGVVSHFAIDAIPHWDYPLRSISVGPGSRPALTLTWSLFRDFGLIGLDACLGLAVALWLYTSPAGAPSNTATISRVDSQQAQAYVADRGNFAVLIRPAGDCGFRGAARDHGLKLRTSPERPMRSAMATVSPLYGFVPANGEHDRNY